MVLDSKAGGVLLLSCILASAAVGYHIDINDNYMLDVEVNNTNKIIEFRITAINVTGWVGVGINDKGKVMAGGDFFIGGFSKTDGRQYGGDYYVPTDGNKHVSIRDKVDNWAFNITEAHGTTYVTASRPFNTSDTQHDTEITDKFTNLLWAYHMTSDNLIHHDKSGAYPLNLITGVPNKDSGSGADIIRTCAGTLIMGLVAAVLKY